MLDEAGLVELVPVWLLEFEVELLLEFGFELLMSLLELWGVVAEEPAAEELGVVAEEPAAEELGVVALLEGAAVGFDWLEV